MNVALKDGDTIPVETGVTAVALGHRTMFGLKPTAIV